MQVTLIRIIVLIWLIGGGWSYTIVSNNCMCLLFACRYLLEDQLKGPSSVEGYISALRKGCRCVECKTLTHC